MSAEAYGEREEPSSLSADFKFPSSDLADDLNNFKQASLGNQWFAELTGSTSASLLVETSPCATTAILCCAGGGLYFDWLGENTVFLGALKHK